jgi:hypothetical protein
MLQLGAISYLERRLSSFSGHTSRYNNPFSSFNLLRSLSSLWKNNTPLSGIYVDTFCDQDLSGHSWWDSRDFVLGEYLFMREISYLLQKSKNIQLSTRIFAA